MDQPAFHLFEPRQRTSGVVFSSPHSCRAYPQEFLAATQLDGRAIRSSEDAYVDMIFGAAPELGAPLLLAGVPRAYLDLNRNVDELDPALIEGARRHGHNPRVASGLGVIPRVVANGRAIYSGKLPMAEAQRRIQHYWHPYHQTLQSLLDTSLAQFGEAILIDCHSMPHEAMDGVSRGLRKAPEIVLGDRFGAAAGAAVVDRIEAAFAAADLTVTRNAPFAGAREEGGAQRAIRRVLPADAPGHRRDCRHRSDRAAPRRRIGPAPSAGRRHSSPRRAGPSERSASPRPCRRQGRSDRRSHR